MNSRFAVRLPASISSAALAFALALALAATFARADARQRSTLRGLAVSGCAAVVAPDICELPRDKSRTLCVWLPRASKAEPHVELYLNGVPRDVARIEPLPDGLTLHLPLQLRDERLSLALRVDGELVLELSIRAAPAWPWQAETERASNAETRQSLGTRLDGARGAERSKLLRVLADAEIALGDRERAARLLREGAEVALSTRRYSEARSHWLRLAYHRAQAHDFGAAAEALGRARAVPSALFGIDADGAAATAYVAANHAFALRDLRAAEAAYDLAAAWVERGSTLMAPQVAAGRAQIAEQQGRLRDATRLLEGALGTELGKTSPCFRALVTARLGWYELELAVRGPVEPRTQAVVRAEQRLAGASALYGSECRRAPPEEAAFAELYLGFAALAAGDVRAAHERQRRAGALVDFPRARMWSGWLEAEVLLAESRAGEAEAAFGRLGEAAERRLYADLTFRAREGAARSLVAQNRLEEAVLRYQEAEAVLAKAYQWIPVDRGALLFLSGHARSAEGLAKTLLQLGRDAEAFSALRRARRRAIEGLARTAEAPPPSSVWPEALGRYLAARERVDQTANRLETAPRSEQALDQKELAAARDAARGALDALVRLTRDSTRTDAERPLRDARPDEALLLWSEIDGTWHGFLAFRGEVHHQVRVSKPEEDGWLVPFEPWLAKARELSVLAEGALTQVDVHRIAQQHFSALLVTYSLDLPTRPMKGSEGDHHVLIGDAHGDLPEARLEVDLLRRMLDERHELAVSLVGPRLLPRDLRRALVNARRLHYAGHAEFSGTDGFQSEFSFSNTKITAGDILSWPSVPAEVILSSCDAARDLGLPHTVGVGLAQAFLLRGSRAVVAPSRPISDLASRRFALALWRELMPDKSLELAYGKVLATLPPADEARAFRLLRSQ